MTTVEKTGIARRPFLMSIAAVLGFGAAGGLIYEVPRLFGRRYPRTQFDDLLDQIPDRESAAKLGHAAVGQVDAQPFAGAATAANDLRNGPGKGSLARAADDDISRGRLIEVQGWVLPLSVVLAASIAAEVQPATPGMASG
jgi:hypothetical protein